MNETKIQIKINAFKNVSQDLNNIEIRKLKNKKTKKNMHTFIQTVQYVNKNVRFIVL